MGKARWSASKGEAAWGHQGRSSKRPALSCSSGSTSGMSPETEEKEVGREKYVRESRFVSALRVVWVTGGHLK